MKVVLLALNGSWGHSNLAVRCLREPLERLGYQVVIKEYTLKDRTAHILEALYRERAEVYGFSCYIWSVEEILPLAEALHALLPESHVVLGGPEVSFETARFDGMDWIDAIVTGEGEDAFASLCQAIERGAPHDRIIAGAPYEGFDRGGILYRDGEPTGGILYYEGSRGCPFGCAYCLSSATKGLRQKSVETVLSDLGHFETLDASCKVIKFVDRTFNASSERANAIWRALLSDEFTKCYHFEICAALLNEESYEILSQFPKGKVRLEIGLQSTNPRTLDAVARHLSAKKTVEAATRLHAMGNLHVHLDLIAGLPYEDYESFGRSFDEAYRSCDVLQLGFLKLLYGTRLCREAEQHGYVSLPKPPYTVLKSHWMSYSEMQKLAHISEVLERYHESGRFAHALWYIEPYMISPFAFWEGLSDYLKERDDRPLQRISQPDAFRYFLRYAREAVDGIDEETLKRMLCADFSTYENKKPPYFLREGTEEQNNQ